LRDTTRQALVFIKMQVTGQELSFYAIVAAVVVYVGVSLFGPRRKHDMDRLLHRGRYAIQGETATSYRDARNWLERIGISRDFVGSDRVIAWGTAAWTLLWTGVFVVGTSYRLLATELSNDQWAWFWRSWLWLMTGVGAVVTLWFFVGGLRDLRSLYRDFEESTPDESDRGQPGRDRGC
jgi:SSS family solute:Na+ symporter